MKTLFGIIISTVFCISTVSAQQKVSAQQLVQSKQFIFVANNISSQPLIAQLNNPVGFYSFIVRPEQISIYLPYYNMFGGVNRNPAMLNFSNESYQYQIKENRKRTKTVVTINTRSPRLGYTVTLYMTVFPDMRASVNMLVSDQGNMSFEGTIQPLDSINNE